MSSSVAPAFWIRRLFVLLMLLAVLAVGATGAALVTAQAAIAKETAQGEVSSPKKPVKAQQVPRKSRKTEDTESKGITLSAGSQGGDVKASESAKEAAAASAQAGTSEASKVSVRKVKARSVRRPRSVKSKAQIVVSKSPPKEIRAVAKGPLAEADALIQAKDWSGALSIYNRILKNDRKNAKALQGKVYALEQSGAETALDALDDMIDRNPSLASAYAARARILVKQKDTIEALGSWKKAVELEPGNKDYRYGLAVLHDQLGHGKEALKLYRALPEPLPQDAQKRLEYLSDHEDELN